MNTIQSVPFHCTEHTINNGAICNLHADCFTLALQIWLLEYSTMDCIKTVVTIIIQRQIPFHRCLQNLMTSGIASLAFPKSSALKTCTMPESIIREGPQFHHRRHFAFMHKRLCDKFNHRWCYGLSIYDNNQPSHFSWLQHNYCAKVFCCSKPTTTAAVTAESS